MGTQSTWGLYCGLTMHYLLLALSFFVASAQVIPTCDECKAAVDGLVTRLTSDASIDEQTTILISMLCPAVPDPQQCEDGLTVAWPEIGRAVYPKFLESTSVCTQLGSCTLRDGPARRVSMASSGLPGSSMPPPQSPRSLPSSREMVSVASTQRTLNAPIK